MNSIEKINGYLKLQQPQISKVDEDSEQEKEQTFKTDEQKNATNPQKNFTERGFELLNTMDYIAKAAKSNITNTKNIETTKQNSLDTVCKIFNLKDENTLEKLTVDSKTGKLKSFTYDGKNYAVTYSGNNISSIIGKYTTGKTAQSINIGYKNGNISSLDVTNYAINGKYKNSRTQTTYNTDGTKKSETVYIYKKNTTSAVASKVITSFNNDNSQTIKTYNANSKGALELTSEKTIMPEVQNPNTNVEKIMSEDGKSIVSVSYATDLCRYINNGTITEITDKYGKVTGYKQELNGKTINYDADLFMTSYITKSGQTVFFPDNTVNYSAYKDWGLTYGNVGTPGWCSCSVGNVAIWIFDDGTKVREHAFYNEAGGYIQAPTYTDENGNLHILQEKKTIDGSQFILKYNPIQSSDDTFERNNVNLKASYEIELTSVILPNGRTVEKPANGTISVTNDGTIVTSSLKDNGNTKASQLKDNINIIATYNAKGEIIFMTTETFDNEGNITQINFSDKKTNHSFNMNPLNSETVIKNSDGSYTFRNNDSNSYITYDEFGIMTNYAEQDGKDIKIVDTYVFDGEKKPQTININGKNAIVKMSSDYSSLRTTLSIDENGRINIESNSHYVLDFSQADFDLDINVMRSSDALVIKSGTGNDNITVQNGAFVYKVQGNEGNDTIIAKGLVHYIEGNKGDDNIISYSNDSIINGNEGNDTITNNYNNKRIQNLRIEGDAGDDVIINNGISDYISGGDGNDTITNNGNLYYILGGSGNDEITNFNKIQRYINGNEGNDKINNYGEVRDYNNFFSSSEYSKKINGIHGGDGNDTIVNHEDAIADKLVGENGTDTIVNNGTLINYIEE